MSNLASLRNVKVASVGRKTGYSSYEEEQYTKLGKVIVAVVNNPDKDLSEVIPAELEETAITVVETMPLLRNPSLIGAAIKVMQVDEAANLDDQTKFPAPKPREWAAINAKLRSICKAEGLKDDQLNSLFGVPHHQKKSKKSWAV